LIPLTIVPLWDAELAASEVRRCAEKGSFAVTFTENPYALGMPSMHTGYWDPLFAACEQTESTVCLHIGSSSKMPTTSPDAPWIVGTSIHWTVSSGSILDFIFSGTLDRFPGLKLFYAESQAGWLPFMLAQADHQWALTRNMAIAAPTDRPPSTYVRDHMYTSIFDDQFGLNNHKEIVAPMSFETDYPHSVTTFPNSRQRVAEMCTNAKLTDEEIVRFLRLNAIDMLGLERFGIVA
jgi:predicted TIM-barrel fold metal-dependent hydrolase